jgi:hypothetical protein
MGSEFRAVVVKDNAITRSVLFLMLLWIKTKCCGEILNFDICILKIDTNARFF